MTNLVAHLFSLATVMFLRGALAAVPKAVISGFLLYMAGSLGHLGTLPLLWAASPLAVIFLVLHVHLWSSTQTSHYHGVQTSSKIPPCTSVSTLLQCYFMMKT